MKVVCENGMTIDCKGYKAVKSGVVVMDDEDRKNVVAFVPNENLQYVLPDDVIEQNRDKLDLPEPQIESPQALDEQLDQFEQEIYQLESNLDQQISEMSDEESELVQEVEQRRQHLEEHVSAVERQIAEVIDRAEHLSRATGGEESEERDAAAGEEREAEQRAALSGASDEVGELRQEFDERISSIEDTLDRLVREREGREAEEEEQPAEAQEAGEAEQPAESEEEQAGEGEEEQAGEGESIESITGLGDTYRDRLEDEGINTIDDLASSDADTVAEAANTSQSRAQEWIDQAEERRQAPEA